MVPRKLSDDLFYLGGNDRRLERFENMFSLPGGVSYNSYLLRDEQSILLDTVDHAVAESYVESIGRALAGKSLSAIVVNHVEPDHAASLQLVMDAFPEARVCCSPMALRILRQFYPSYAQCEGRFSVINEETRLSTGQHELRFFTAANVHWPEVTFTYDATTASLFSADAFGSFGAPAGYLFWDEVDDPEIWEAEFRRYYCNIVGRQGLPVRTVLKKLEGLEIQAIYPLHGLLARTPQTIARLSALYRNWASYQAEQKGVVLVYGSLYNHSAAAADCLAAELAGKKAGALRIYDVSKTDISVIIAELFRFSHAVFFCNNYNTELYPRLDSLLRELRMLNWDNHAYSIVSNGSWGGRGAAIAEDLIKGGAAMRKVGETVSFRSALGAEGETALSELAKVIAGDMKD